MSAPILVATPHSAFGELLRISLEDSGQYQVRLVQSAREARAAVHRASFPLAILDAILADEPFVSLCYELIEQQPGIRLVIIPPDNNPNHPSLGGLIPHGYLSRPFYLPDMLDTVSRLLADRERQLHAQAAGQAIPAAGLSVTLPPWLQEPLTLRGYLEKELAGTQALSAMVGLNGSSPGSGTLRASAGTFSDEAAQELASVVFRYWNHSEKTDLMRFVRVSADKKDHLVYATQISGDLVLILVYDTAASLSQIRPQTRAIAQALATQPPTDYNAGRKITAPERPTGSGSFSTADEPHTQPLEAKGHAESGGEEELLASRLSGISTSGQISSATAGAVESLPANGSTTDSTAANDLQPTRSMHDLPSTAGVEPADSSILNEEESEQPSPIINLSALLGAVPPPDPQPETRNGSTKAVSWQPGDAAYAPIPTLPGGWNGWERDESESFKPFLPQVFENAAANHAEAAAAEALNAAENSASNNGGWQGSKKKLPMTAPLDPAALELERDSTSLPLDSLPASTPQSASASGISNQGMQESSTPITRRPASAEVHTEPPVKPAAVPARISPTPQAIEPEAPADLLEDTRPRLVASINDLSQLEPASPALSLLNYTCVLVPRLPQHYLTGEMADRLSLWVQQLCLAFGWRLEGIAIRPEYLQWTVQVAPAISPGNLVKVIRQRTSMHIFGGFPHLAEQNPSGDFWATGYLIVSGAQPPSAQLLRDYITQTRKRQGILK